MNIFVLDLDPQKCAEYHCNKHLVKMLVEHNQIFGSIAYSCRGIRKKKEITPDFINQVFKDFPRKRDNQPHPYGIGYVNHPCTQWTAKSLSNYKWLISLTLEMCKEYTRRYSKKHSCEAITHWYANNCPEIPDLGLTPFAQAMPEDCKNSANPVAAYRNYYKKYKAGFAKWPADKIPYWWNT